MKKGVNWIKNQGEIGTKCLKLSNDHVDSLGEKIYQI